MKKNCVPAAKLSPIIDRYEKGRQRGSLFLFKLKAQTLSPNAPLTLPFRFWPSPLCS